MPHNNEVYCSSYVKHHLKTIEENNANKMTNEVDMKIEKVKDGFNQSDNLIEEITS